MYGDPLRAFVSPALLIAWAGWTSAEGALLARLQGEGHHLHESAVAVDAQLRSCLC
jgi:hypothetical protein